MQEINLEELKKIEVSILEYVHDFCKKNNLQYFLSGGTLLGAIRHKGFIPWDDDIDIVMPRTDYMSFLEIFDGGSQFKLLSPGMEGYFYNFSKVVDNTTLLMEKGVKKIAGYGIYIDVFPMDGMPDDDNERVSHFNELNDIRNCIHKFSISKPKFRKNIIRFFEDYKTYFWTRSSDLSQYQKDYLEKALKYSYDESQYIYMTGGAYGIKEIYKKSLFSNAILVEFENRLFCAPEMYDEYLTLTYGDYMKLPPKDKQVSHHHFIARYIN